MHAFTSFYYFQFKNEKWDRKAFSNRKNEADVCWFSWHLSFVLFKTVIVKKKLNISAYFSFRHLADANGFDKYKNNKKPIWNSQMYFGIITNKYINLLKQKAAEDLKICKSFQKQILKQKTKSNHDFNINNPNHKNKQK